MRVFASGFALSVLAACGGDAVYRAADAPRFIAPPPDLPKPRIAYVLGSGGPRLVRRQQPLPDEVLGERRAVGGVVRRREVRQGGLQPIRFQDVRGGEAVRQSGSVEGGGGGERNHDG